MKLRKRTNQNGSIGFVVSISFSDALAVGFATDRGETFEVEKELDVKNGQIILKLAKRDTARVSFNSTFIRNNQRDLLNGKTLLDSHANRWWIRDNRLYKQTRQEYLRRKGEATTVAEFDSGIFYRLD